MFVLKVSCLIIYFQNQRQCVGAVEVLILHHVLLKVSPSGRRQHLIFPLGAIWRLLPELIREPVTQSDLGATRDWVLPYQWFSITNTIFPFFSRNFHVVGTRSQDLRDFWK